VCRRRQKRKKMVGNCLRSATPLTGRGYPQIGRDWRLGGGDRLGLAIERYAHSGGSFGRYCSEWDRISVQQLHELIRHTDESNNIEERGGASKIFVRRENRDIVVI